MLRHLRTLPINGIGIVDGDFVCMEGIQERMEVSSNVWLQVSQRLFVICDVFGQFWVLFVNVMDRGPRVESISMESLTHAGLY